jgi:hypothetical protein
MHFWFTYFSFRTPGPSGSGKKGAGAAAAPPKGQKSILDMFKKAPAKRRSGSPDPNGTKKAKTGEKASAGEVRRLIVGRCRGMEYKTQTGRDVYE